MVRICWLLPLLLLSWGRPAPAHAQAARPRPLSVAAFLTLVPPERGLVLRLRRFAPATGLYATVDSARLITDGSLTLTSPDTVAGLYVLVLADYSRTELILAPGAAAHFAASVPQLARDGALLEASPETDAYNALMTVVEGADSLQARLHDRLRTLPDSAAHQSTLTERRLEALHRRRNQQLRERAAAAPGSFAATVVLPLALLPERPAAQVGAGGYVAWLGAHALDGFPVQDLTAARHYLGAARLAYYVETLGDHLPGGRRAAIDRLMARRQGHDPFNGWLYYMLLTQALAHDDAPTALYLHQNYADGCAPALPYDLLRELETVRDLQPGAPVPDLTLPDSTGHPQSLRAYAARYPLTVVFGWVSWCRTCEQLAPRLAALQQKKGYQKLGVYAVSLDDDGPTWRRAVRRQATPRWQHVAELVPPAQSTAVQRLHIRRTPRLLLLDRQARIVGTYNTLAELTAALR